MPKAWTTDEIQFAQENWKTMPKAEIADRLGRTLNAVVHYAYQHGWSQHAPSQTYEHLTPEEKAYIAGIIDGEGHIEIRLGIPLKTRRGLSYSVSVMVANTDYALLDWLHRRLPGSYVRQRIVRRAKPHWKPQWTLRLHRRGSVKSLLGEILPYLVAKRTRAIEAIAAIESIRKSYWR